MNTNEWYEILLRRHKHLRENAEGPYCAFCGIPAYGIRGTMYYGQTAPGIGEPCDGEWHDSDLIGPAEQWLQKLADDIDGA